MLFPIKSPEPQQRFSREVVPSAHLRTEELERAETAILVALGREHIGEPRLFLFESQQTQQPQQPATIVEAVAATAYRPAERDAYIAAAGTAALSQSQPQNVAAPTVPAEVPAAPAVTPQAATPEAQWNSNGAQYQMYVQQNLAPAPVPTPAVEDIDWSLQDQGDFEDYARKIVEDIHLGATEDRNATTS